MKRIFTVPCVLLILMFALVALALQFRTPNIADPDGFYHFRHAQIMREQGVFSSAFPWAQFSEISETSADLWYGFHVLLMPFTYLVSEPVAIKFAGAAGAFALLMLVWAALRKLKVKGAALWALLFIIATPDIPFRIAMTRPHVLSLGLMLFIFAATLEGSPWAVAVAAMLFASLHLSVAWIPVVVIGVILFFSLVHRAHVPWKHVLGMSAGLLAGMLARPNPAGGLQLAYTQVVRFAAVKAQELPLRFGRELVPFGWENFVTQLLPLALLVVIALCFLGWAVWSKNFRTIEQKRRIALWSSLALAALFGILAFTAAGRAAELAAAFAVVALALIASSYPAFASRAPFLFSRAGRWATGLVIAATLLYMGVNSLQRSGVVLNNAFPQDKFKEASQWLAANARPKEIVFNPHWDTFAMLFFWNPANYYINGMDPIFLYAYDQNQYWRLHFIATDKASDTTCPLIRCNGVQIENTYDVLKNKFRASYIFVQKLRIPRFTAYLEQDRAHYEKTFDNKSEAIFRIRR